MMTTTTGKLFLDLFHHPLLLVALTTVASSIITSGSSHSHPLRLTRRLIMMAWQLFLNLISYSLLLPPPTLPIILLSLCRILVNTRIRHIN